MSHFSVAVFHKPEQSIKGLLAPYSEVDEEYFVAEPLTDGEVELTRSAYRTKRNVFDTYDEFMSQCYGYKLIDGAWSRWRNPNAKWDWYSEGGRWSGELTTKDGEDTDEDIVKNIDWSPDPATYIQAYRFWEVVVDEKPLRKGEKREWYDTFYKRQYYTERYRSAEDYARECASSSPYAFVDSDGKWHGKGNMGWFACDDATAESIEAYEDEFEAYVASHPDEIVTMIDCHI